MDARLRDTHSFRVRVFHTIHVCSQGQPGLDFWQVSTLANTVATNISTSAKLGPWVDKGTTTVIYGNFILVAQFLCKLKTHLLINTLQVVGTGQLPRT